MGLGISLDKEYQEFDLGIFLITPIIDDGRNQLKLFWTCIFKCYIGMHLFSNYFFQMGSNYAVFDTLALRNTTTYGDDLNFWVNKSTHENETLKE